MKVKDMTLIQATAILDELQALTKLKTVDGDGFDTGRFVGDMKWLRTRISELKERIDSEKTGYAI